MTSELEQFYQIKLDENADSTLDELIRGRFPKDKLTNGSSLQFESVVLRVREISEQGMVEYVGMTIVPPLRPETTPESTASPEADRTPENNFPPSPSPKRKESENSHVEPS